jgi:protein TonB
MKNMKNTDSRSFAVTFCAAALLHAGALVLVPDISRSIEAKPEKTPVQVSLSFPQEAPALPPPAPEQTEAKETPPIAQPEPAGEPPVDPVPAEADLAQETAQDSDAEPDAAGEAPRGFQAEPAAVVSETSGAMSGVFDPNVQAALLLQYETSIRRLIDKHKEYPYQARRQEQEGTVEISFVLSRQGQLMEEPVLGKRTRYRLLNNAALEAVKKAVPYPPFPHGFPEEKMAFSITLTFSLTGNTF